MVLYLLKSHRSHFVMLDALFTEVKNARCATIPRAHSRLELRTVSETAILFFITHAHPRLLNVLIELKFVLGVASCAHLGPTVRARHIFTHSRHHSIRDHRRVCVLDDSLLDLGPGHSDCLALFGGLACAHVLLR